MATWTVTTGNGSNLRRTSPIAPGLFGKRIDHFSFSEIPQVKRAAKADPIKLKDLSIWGTVFEGKAYPIEKAAKGLVMSPETQKRMTILAEYDAKSFHEHHADACIANQILQAFAAMLEK